MRLLGILYLDQFRQRSIQERILDTGNMFQACVCHWHGKQAVPFTFHQAQLNSTSCAVRLLNTKQTFISKESQKSHGWTEGQSEKKQMFSDHYIKYSKILKPFKCSMF